MSYPVIPRSRFTEKACREFVADLNDRLEAAGADLYMHVAPRNGYCAIDIVSRKRRASKPVPGWSAVERMLVGGTPRECAESAREFYYTQLEQANKK